MSREFPGSFQLPNSLTQSRPLPKPKFCSKSKSLPDCVWLQQTCPNKHYTSVTLVSRRIPASPVTYGVTWPNHISRAPRRTFVFLSVAVVFFFLFTSEFCVCLIPLCRVNVCGGQCCHGWSQAQGSQRCIKPNCSPQCQNGGMCLRPQLCVCKPGSKGKPAHEPTNGHNTGHTNGHTTGHTNGYNVVPQRPIPQQGVPPNGYASAPSPASNMAQMKLTVKPYQQLVIRPVPIHPAQNQQYVLKPKYYHTHTTHTQTHVQSQPERPIPLRVGHNPFHVGNHTGRIKVVFTPTICKLTCIGGRCHNNCELGNTTTIISENGRATDTLTAPNFRVVVCHLPCMNGGKCSTRDKCQCPPNFTGKFCQMPVQNGHHQTQVHSTHTLPLTYSNGQSTGDVVNIHIKHPPEASVQVHRVSHLDNYQNNGNQLKGSQSIYPNQHDYQVPQYQPVASKNTLGRCFQETTGSQCGKVLPGLTKQEQCCGTIGTSWGFHKCQKCPKKPSIPLIDCPQGYKRINSSHCQDFDECQLQGACPNGNCLNTVGSYRCMCKPGYVPDPTLTTCISDTPAVQEEKGPCFRLVSSGRQCLHPVSAQLSKQLCCCSVGKAWGPHCDKCPPPGTAKFKEICPGGMGYTVLPNPPVNKPVTVHQQPIDLLPPQPLPTPERPVEAFGKPEEIIPVLNLLLYTLLSLFNSFSLSLSLSSGLEVDACQINPNICGQGICYNTAEGYTCHCDEGYPLDDSQTTCVDLDECSETPSLCVGGLCRNTEGSFLCVCPRGFLVDEEGTSCVGKYLQPLVLVGSYTRQCSFLIFFSDIDECINRTVCPSGICLNVPGSYNCASCPNGFLAQGGQCVGRSNSVCGVYVQGLFTCSCNGDIDECQDERVCTRGHCLNTEGSFICECGPGFRGSATGHECDDVDECVEEAGPCEPVGECVNSMGSYTCTCPQGYQQINGTSCRGERWSTHTSSHPPRWVFSPVVPDFDECMDEQELCSPNGECLNTEGSYLCVCESGFTTNLDTPSCDDVNECELLSSVCGEAQCVNMDGSFLCMCPSGQDYNVMVAKCEPVPTVSSVERKECYYQLSDENLCESVLTSHVTLQECCCTLGAGWGDNCEVHPCPVNGTDQFNQMCPSGRGLIPSEDLLYGVPTDDNADECTLFGEEVCKGGFCLDTVGSYECYCKTGQDYDSARLECRDINECLDESVCVGGQCLNTEGSYMCFCTHPMVLDPDSNRCVFIPEVAEQIDYQGICWQMVTQTMTCTQPFGLNRKTTYTECCCLYGEAWGMDCALCPPRNTEDYASMCNLPLGGGRRPYGHDALTAGPVHEYEVGPDYSPSPEQDLKNSHPPYKAFEGLRAEECGILNGCENGRCVRVQEGYTCDCFDGYTLDLSRMACVDVNECSELNNRMSLCKNAKCINTVGSYQCVCLPGFTASDRPNYCVEVAARHASTRTQ
uniref:Latent-transforming growth factor beta-binding protein 4 n=1 Tax=Scophthalmus maximus TaxID=52904 RepID=A0A8D3CN80_SCOMX